MSILRNLSKTNKNPINISINSIKCTDKLSINLIIQWSKNHIQNIYI